MTKPKYTVAELFCGCGGFSHGFSLTGRFDVALGIDVKRFALRTFARNHRINGTQPARIEQDIRSVSMVQINKALESVGVDPSALDCLIGGPPCQGFSQLRRGSRQVADGVRFTGYDRLANDPRNDLVFRFLKIAESLRPRFIIIENVPQMLRHGFEGRLGGLAETISDILHRHMGYSVTLGVLNAADFGVPQIRERAIFLASRDEALQLPRPTHCDVEGAVLPLTSCAPWTTVRDAISDLPRPPIMEDTLANTGLEAYPAGKISAFAARMRSHNAFPNGHVTRSYARRIVRLIEEMRPGETWDAASARMRAHYDDLISSVVGESGESQSVVRQRLVAQDLLLPAFYKDYYWSAYTRLAWDRPALTVTANANFLGSGRFTHPSENRGITVREAARLQSFDDDFCFETTERSESRNMSIGIAMDMIGEAVPPVLGQAIANQIVSRLDGHNFRSEVKQKNCSRLEQEANSL